MVLPSVSPLRGRHGATMSRLNLALRELAQPTGDLLDVEIVERKGTGHPDTICDEIAEQLSLALAAEYAARCGVVLHHNVDKALLVGGASAPAFGGGALTAPMELFMAGRATTVIAGEPLPIGAIAQRVATEWFAETLPLVVPGRDLLIHDKVRATSADLGGLFARQGEEARLANDTSCGVGYAPLSRLERIVLAVETGIGAAASRMPAIGRDIKVMGVRRGGHVQLTIACALVGRHLRDMQDYLATTQRIAAMAKDIARSHGADDVAVTVNAADDPDAGEIYLTVTGTSAEAGDDGEAGRGNRINGLIAPFRPMTMESVAGKNAVTHVGKLYNIAASLIAQHLVDAVPGVCEAQCLIVSRIGERIDRPEIVEVAMRGWRGGAAAEASVEQIVQEELARLRTIARDLVAGVVTVGNWPLTRSA